MKKGFFLAFLIGTLAYIISVLLGLILHYPLSRVLFIGLKAFFSLAFAIFVITGLFHVLAPAEDKAEGDSNQETTEDDQEREEGFAPLNPPVLEVENEEDQRGEVPNA